MQDKKIGFIGQGWIGKNYADDFEKRGFECVRYSLEEPYSANKEKIKECDIVFIAVPTPTTKGVFDASILKETVKNVGKGKIAVIKSTMLPGTTELLQKENPEIIIVHSPEFLREKTAAEDAANPERNIIGMPEESDAHKKAAKEVLNVLPKANFELVCKAKDAELIKYAGNFFLYMKVVYANIFYDAAKKLGCSWPAVKEAVAADRRIGKSHMDPEDSLGRGAGGHCLAKDYAAFADFYKNNIGDKLGTEFLKALEDKNLDLLSKSNKDQDLINKIYSK